MGKRLFANIEVERPEPVEEQVYFASGNTTFSEDDFLVRMRDKYTEQENAFNDLIENADLITNVSETLNEQSVPAEIRDSVIAQLSNSFGFSDSQITLNSFKKKRTVTTLSVGSFFRKIWEAILKFVRGFFKMVREFFNAIIGRDARMDRSTKETQKSLEYIRRNNITIKPDNYRTIETRLPVILGMDVMNVNASAVLLRSEEMLLRYEKLINSELSVVMSTLELQFIPVLEECIANIDQKMKSNDSYELILKTMLDMVNSCAGITRTILPHTLPTKDLPEIVKKEIADKNISLDNNIDIVSFVSTDPYSKDKLPSEFNVFCVVPKGQIDFDFMTEHNKNELGFLFFTHYLMNEDMTPSIIDPVTKVDELLSANRVLSKVVKDVKTKELSDRLTRFTNKIDGIIKHLAVNIGHFSDQAETAVKTEGDVESVLRVIGDSYKKGIEYWKPIKDRIVERHIAENSDLDRFDNIESHIEAGNYSQAIYDELKKDPFVLSVVNTIKNDPDIISLMKGGPDYVPLTDDQAEVVSKLPTMINDTLTSGLQGLKTCLDGLILGNLRIYKVLEGNIDGYIRACKEQYKH